MTYKVVARQFGNSVEFNVEAVGIKEALLRAHKIANDTFSYMGFGDEPVVSVNPVK